MSKDLLKSGESLGSLHSPSFLQGVNKKMTSLLFCALLSLSSCDSGKREIALARGSNPTKTLIDSVDFAGKEKIIKNPTLRMKVLDFVLKDNNLSRDDAKRLQVGSKIIFDIDEIKNIVDTFDGTYNGDSNTSTATSKPTTDPGKSDNTLSETVSIPKGFSVISSLDNFKKMSINPKSNKDYNYLVARLYNDSPMKKRVQNLLRDGYSLRVPYQRENPKTPSLSVSDIIKPKEMLSDALQGKSFVLDAGHGGLDTGAIGFAQYGNSANKEMITVYESSVMMDLTYRIAQGLQAHGATVRLTHYYNRRGIVDKKDPPPASRSYNSNKDEVFQDIYTNMSQNHPGLVMKSGTPTMKKRIALSGVHDPDLFVSFHADMIINNRGEINTKDKILSIRTQNLKKRPSSNALKKGFKKRAQYSKNIANKLLKNGFHYTYKGKKAESIKHDHGYQNLGILRMNDAPGILVEVANMSQTDQAYYLRDPNNRQKLADSFVNAMVKTFE